MNKFKIVFIILISAIFFSFCTSNKKIPTEIMYSSFSTTVFGIDFLHLNIEKIIELHKDKNVKFYRDKFNDNFENRFPVSVESKFFIGNGLNISKIKKIKYRVEEVDAIFKEVEIVLNKDYLLELRKIMVIRFGNYILIRDLKKDNLLTYKWVSIPLNNVYMELSLCNFKDYNYDSNEILLLLRLVDRRYSLIPR